MSLESFSLFRHSVLRCIAIHVGRKILCELNIFFALTTTTTTTTESRAVNVFKPPVALFLLIRGLLLLPLFVRVLCLVLLLLFITLCPSSFELILTRERELVALR